MDMQYIVEVHDEMTPRRNRSPVAGRRTPANVGRCANKFSNTLLNRLCRPMSMLEQQHVTSVTGRPQRGKERHSVIA